ncbi:putative heavy-metal-binding-domain-containing protein [Phaeosphaeria sp. MPI-PUGE-AT-0046c]|nr:putative heavy-metal-binding-domain-containing protein [Phaeosphaeria sp. MPI-PUGE-AT-0046c]
MLTNRRSTMMVPPSRMPSWHPQSKPYPATPTTAVFDSAAQASDIHPSRVPALPTATTASLPGHSTRRVIGTCHGTVSLTRKDTKSFVKSIAASLGANWGEAKAVTSAICAARDAAVERMIKEAVGRGANAVVGVSVRESEVLGCVVVSVVGTGVWVEKDARGEKRDSAQEHDPFL